MITNDDFWKPMRLSFGSIEFENKQYEHSYAAAFVYLKARAKLPRHVPRVENSYLVYVMERLGKTWFYARWEDIRKINTGTTLKSECHNIVKDDFYDWTNTPSHLGLSLDFRTINTKNKYDSYAVAPVYAWSPVHDYAALTYTIERKDKIWSYARWYGPTTESGTIKECRKAIKRDYEDV